MFSTLAIGFPVGAEWIVIAALGLLIFGKRLPEVGRSIGRGIVEFKKGIKGVEDEINDTVEEESQPRLPDHSTETASKSEAKPEPKFDPYTGKPIEAPKPKFDPYTGKPLEEATTEAVAETTKSA